MAFRQIMLGAIATCAFTMCAQEHQPQVVKVGDLFADVQAKLKANGHERVRIPLDPRIEEMNPDGTTKLVGMQSPYEVNGQTVVFTYLIETKKLTNISLNGIESVKTLDLTPSTRAAPAPSAPPERIVTPSAPVPSEPMAVEPSP
jgi:hypothetical protein